MKPDKYIGWTPPIQPSTQKEQRYFIHYLRSKTESVVRTGLTLAQVYQCLAVESEEESGDYFFQPQEEYQDWLTNQIQASKQEERL